MAQGIIADSVIFYVRQAGEETYQSIDEYDWLKSEGTVYCQRFCGFVMLFKDNNKLPEKIIFNMTCGDLCKIPVRFYVFGWDEEQQEYDILEVGEDEFKHHPGTIDYERHTIRENGASQICLTKGLPQC